MNGTIAFIIGVCKNAVGLDKFKWGLKKILCFGQPDPTYRNRPTLDFFYENTVVFFVGVFIIEVSILKKKLKNRADPT